MSKKGYEFESEVEQLFLDLTGQARKDSLLKFNKKGELVVNRSFRIPNSGAMESIKGDIVTAVPWFPRQLKVECKARRTKLKRGSVVNFDKEWIDKHTQEAKEDHQLAVWAFSFKGVKHNRVWFFLEEAHAEGFFGKSFQDGQASDSNVLTMSASVKASKRTIQFSHNSLVIETLQGQSASRFTYNGLKYILMSRTLFQKLCAKENFPDKPHD